MPVTHRFVRKLDVPRRENVFSQMQGAVWPPDREACELVALGLAALVYRNNGIQTVISPSARLPQA
jgi:hypothetical protein